MNPTHFFKTKATLVVLCSVFGTLVAAGGATPPSTSWNWLLLAAGCALNGATALKAYLSDASSNRAL